MYKYRPITRFTALLLAAVMLFGLFTQGSAAFGLNGRTNFFPADFTHDTAPDDDLLSGEKLYDDDESVRVSIVLEDAPTISASYSLDGIAANEDAMAYRHKLQQIQELVVDNIETYALDGEALDVVWNLTLIANVISANVEYGKIEDIKAMDGVLDVFVEERVYMDLMDTSETVLPAMLGSSAMSGSSLAHAAGFTGAGSRVAIIDTGIDTDHRSFNADAFEYSLIQLEKKGLIHIDDLDLMTAETIEGVLSELNIVNKDIDVNSLYYSSKLPFAYNYADPGTDVNHHAGQVSPDMEHGSHVAGIAAANTYVPSNEKPGEFLYAAEEVGVCGMAPDAQILTLRVFDKMGGAYESTYMVAIEDAIILGADSINLSLGSTTAGFNRSNVYADIMENLVNSGTVCVASAGNNGTWADYDRMGGYLLSKDVNFNTLGSPGSFSTTLSVGSVDNSNVQQAYFTVNGQWVFYYAADTDSEPLSSIAGERQYVYLTGDTLADTNTLNDLRKIVYGKIAVCERDGKTPLAAIARSAAEAGAIAIVIVNHEEGTLDPVLAGYRDGKPVVTITKTDGAFLKQAAQAVPGSNDAVYYQGTMTIGKDVVDKKSEYYNMSFFSSFGVPGNLSLAPDIVAPGGNILSVNGRVPGGQDYVTFSGTSMAGPQVAGMSAVLAQYVRDLKFTENNYSARFLIQNLLMSTAVPFKDTQSGYYYPVFQQGSGLADLDRALNAQALILMNEKATPQYADGKVKAEFGDDREKTGVYSYAFTIENFSGKENSYSLSTKLFTQALKKDQTLSNGKKADFLDKLTTRLAADVSYSVDGAPVNAGDSFKVEAYEAVTVSVIIKLTDEQKKILDDSYPNGAYVEGYTFITGVADKEGARDVEYSIPLIGFYGDWGDASMYDYASYTNWLYGDDTLSYVYPYLSSGKNQYANYFSIVDPKTDESRIYTGNPYAIEDQFPVGRGAIRSTDTISGYSTILIRSAAAAAVYLTDSKGQWIGMGNVRNQIEAASNYKGSWTITTIIIPFSRTPASMGLQENDVFNVNVAAVPEYYETNGNISADELKGLIEGKKLGKGATLSAATLTVDDTPPEILSVEKNDDGSLTVTAQDNHYIAYMSITDRSGTVVYGSHVPGGEEGGTVTYTFDLKNANIGPTCVIFVGDYAANSTMKYYNYGREYPSLEGKLGGYIHEGKGDYNKAWTVIDPSDIQSGGNYSIKPVAYHGGDTVTAAAYVDGYVYQVIGSKLYTSPVSEIDNLTELVDLERFRLHSVYALSYNRADHMLYALTDGNTLWSIDPKNGSAAKVAQLTVSGLTDGAGRITSMAIDGKGNFYGFTYYESGSSLLVKWSTEQLKEEQPALTGEKLTGETIRERFGSMAYDAEKDVLYLAEAYADNVSSSYNRLLCIDLNKMSVTYAASSLTYAIRGLFAVPAEDDGDDTLKPEETIKELDILPQELKMFVSGQEDLSPLITPWTAKNQELVWETANEKVVTVKDGIVTAVGTGTATVTVSAAADPDVKDTCTITVEAIPSIQMSAMVYDKDKIGYLASYDVAAPDQWTRDHVLPASYSFYAGGLSKGKLYVHDGYFMYAVDPETYAVEQVMMFSYLDFAWSDVAQVPKGASSFYEASGLYFDGVSRFGTYSRTLRAPLSNALPFASPAATIAYIEDDGIAASCYYILLENGGLYRVSLPTSPLKYEFLGVVPGINLKGVSNVTQGISASMWYDQDTGYLVLSSRIKGETAKVQLIDPESLRVMSNTEFDENVWYATALYQYDKNAASGDKTITNSMTYASEKLPSSENAGVHTVSYAERSARKEVHSVYEGLEELLASPVIRPYAAGSAVACLESTQQTYSTLQEAVDAAHALILQGNHEAQTVTLLANVKESVREVWIRSHIDYDYDLTIDLNGYTITGNGGPVLWFEAGGLGGAKYGFHVTIKDSSDLKTGTITGGTGRLDTFSKTNGGGIYFSGSTVYDSLTISGGNIQDNHVTGNGGAIAISGDSAAQLIISGGVITGNTAANGAVSGRWITMTGGTVTGNQAFETGGGLYLWGAGTQELKIADGARVYDNVAGTMGDDIVVISQRGGVTYNVELCDPDDSWYADGADGPYDHTGTNTIERFDAINPQRLNSCTVHETGRTSPAYGIAAKYAHDTEDETVYTVVYTDGANGTVFQKQEYSGLKAGTKTPLFDDGIEPTRPGYLFVGWDPAWSSTVTEDVTYVAQWEEIKADGVTLDHTEISLNEGESGALNAVVIPSTALHQTVQWSVEPKDTVVILTCEGNHAVLQAVGAGTATVIAEINGIRETCTVIVNHVWEEPEFDWKQVGDGYSVIVTRKCTLGHVQTVAAEATVKEEIPPTCITNGSVIYTVTVSFDGEEFTQIKEVTVPATGHSYSNYQYDNNATYWEDGTETAYCDNGCGTKNTRPANGTKLIDSDAPTAVISVSGNRWYEFLNTITFGLFFNETQDVTIEAEDTGVGPDKIYYYLSSYEISKEEIENTAVWTEYTGTFRIDPDRRLVIYVKVSDLLGNTEYYSSDGIVLDSTPPSIKSGSSLKEGGVYCLSLTGAFEEENMDKILVNGKEMVLDDSGCGFTMAEGSANEPIYGELEIAVYDKAGNILFVHVTLNAQHSGGKAACTEKAVCDVCGNEYGEFDPNRHGKTEIRGAKNATCTDDGYTGDTYCTDCENKIADGKIITAGHKWGEWIIIKEATETEKGLREHTCLVCGEKETGNIAPRCLGDVNADGKIDGTDATLLLQFMAGWDVAGIVNMFNSDVNQDGEINGIDASLLLQYLAGWFDTFPV